jgi:hypothetical protein
MSANLYMYVDVWCVKDVLDVFVVWSIIVVENVLCDVNIFVGESFIEDNVRKTNKTQIFPSFNHHFHNTELHWLFDITVLTVCLCYISL